MNILYYVVIALHIVACFFLIGVVLLQQGKGQDLASAFGGGGTQAAFGPRGSATVLSRATTILAGVFMLTSLGLTLLRPSQSGLLDSLPAQSAAPQPVAPASPAAPVASQPVAPAASQPAAPATTAPAPAASPASR